MPFWGLTDDQMIFPVVRVTTPLLSGLLPENEHISNPEF
jgi:hypothetical protein